MENFFEQPLKTLKIGNFTLEVPESHILLQLANRQPYRDLCIGISAKYLSEKYHNQVIVDVGANIGDTAAMIASYCQNKMILIEVSDYFLQILRKNILKIPNETIIQSVFISDGSSTQGLLYHWGGTAFFQEDTDEGIKVNTAKIADIVEEETCFIKVDTDGFDFKILLSSIDWLSDNKPGIIFENQIRNQQDLELANHVSRQLNKVGYKYFTVWDDPGYHMLSTSSLEYLLDLNRYLFKVWEIKESHRSIFNFDVLCLHERDLDIHDKVHEYYKNY